MRHVIVTLSILMVGCQAQESLEQDQAHRQSISQVPPQDIQPGAEIGCDPVGYPFGGGTGAQADPYQICSSDQFGQIQNYLSSALILSDDLDLAGIQWSHNGQFTGTLDGDGHTLSNFTAINSYFSSSLGSAGLFGSLSGVVKNLSFSNVLIDGYTDVGVVAADIDATGVVENVHVLSGSITGVYATGGIAGGNWGTVSNCTGNASTVSQLHHDGALVGDNYGVIQ